VYINQVLQSVINDVIGSVRESFLDESVDENVLMELRNLWQQKLDASKAIDTQVSDAAILDNKMNSMRGRTVMGGAQPPPPAAAANSGPQKQMTITDPNGLVPVQITIPAQQNNPNSQPRKLTVQVPGHALQQGSNSGTTLQRVLTQAITMALAFPQDEAARYLQQQIDSAFRLA